MKLPDRDYYTVEELLEERWKHIWPDMTADFINYLIDYKKIDASFSEWDEKKSIYTKSISIEEVKRYEAENNISTSSAVVDNPKAIGTLLKLVATMAIKGYRYNPAEVKSSIPSEVVKDADSLGLSINEKTVREWLKKAASIVDRKNLQ